MKFVCISLITIAFCVSPVLAADRHYSGSIGIENPIGISPDRPQDRSANFFGDLHLSHVVGPVGIFASGEVRANKGLPYSKEDKFKVGVEMPVGTSGLTVFSYYERRPVDVTASRVMVGCKWSFSGGY